MNVNGVVMTSSPGPIPAMRKAISMVLMLFGISLSAAAAWFRLHDHSPLDILLNASAKSPNSSRDTTGTV